MPGRPKTMLTKVAKLEEEAIVLAAEFFKAEPRQYREDRHPMDPIGQAWNAAETATMVASIKLEELGDLLRAKAGLGRPGLCGSEECRSDGQERSRGEEEEACPRGGDKPSCLLAEELGLDSLR